MKMIFLLVVLFVLLVVFLTGGIICFAGGSIFFTGGIFTGCIICFTGGIICLLVVFFTGGIISDMALSMFPRSGPVAGGTDAIISGNIPRSISPSLQVKIAYLDCVVQGRYTCKYFIHQICVCM